MATRKKPTPAPAPQKKTAPKAKATPAAKAKRAPVSAKTTAPPAKKARVSAQDTPKAKKAAKPRAQSRKEPPPPPAPGDEDASTPLNHELMGLSIREARFVDRYVVSMNGALAYIEAGFTAKNNLTARVCASRLLTRANVAAYLRLRLKEMIARDEEHQDSLMARLKLQAFGDARELSEYHKGSCRYCWGKLHRWQFTAGEWDQKMTEFAEKQEKAAEAEKPMPKPPDPKGGTGYTWGRDPNPECPECSGHGVGKTIIHDTRHMSPAGVALFAGVKEGKDGIEVKLRDQDKALDTLVKVAKLYDDSSKINVAFSAEDLEATFGNVMQAAHETAERLRKERGLDSGKTQAG